MADPEKRITVKVPETLHRRVKVKAAMLGKSISDVLREYLEAWIEEPLPEPEKKQDQQLNRIGVGRAGAGNTNTTLT